MLSAPHACLFPPLCLTVTIINERAASSLMGAGVRGDLRTQVLNKGTDYLQDTLKVGIPFGPNEDRAFIIAGEASFSF